MSSSQYMSTGYLKARWFISTGASSVPRVVKLVQFSKTQLEQASPVFQRVVQHSFASITPGNCLAIFLRSLVETSHGIIFLITHTSSNGSSVFYDSKCRAVCIAAQIRCKGLFCFYLPQYQQHFTSPGKWNQAALPHLLPLEPKEYYLWVPYLFLFI